MKSAQLILIEAQLQAVRPLAADARNHELAALAADREIQLLKDLRKERERLAQAQAEDARREVPQAA
jgi:hypothetical protein